MSWILLPSLQNASPHKLFLMEYSCGNISSSTMQRECDSCRSAPAAVYCRADAAALCTACDADIHAANPISRRHHRVPVVRCSYERDGEYADGLDGERSNNYEALFGEEEEVFDCLDLVGFNSCTADQDRQKQIFDGRERVKSEVSSTCVVPVQSLVLPKKNSYHEMEYEVVSNAGFSYSAPVGQCVSLSSTDASLIVPNNTGNSNSYAEPPKGTMELFTPPLLHMPAQFSPMDREARVLRYREKKKNRKFEKTIRYASRKAYAEARPRIKGRFAKRTDIELEVDQMFSTYAIPEDGYGIVPWF